MLLQGIQAPFSASTGKITIICDLSPRESNALFWPPQALHAITHTWGTHITCRQHTRHISNNNLQKRNWKHL